MRKFVLSAVALFVTVGLTLAAQVTLVKFDEEAKTMTVKDKDGKEDTYKITDSTVFKAGDKEVKYEVVVKRLSNPKAAGKAKFDISTDSDKVTEVKFPAPKKKKDKSN